MIGRLALAIVLGAVLMTTTAQSVQAARPQDEAQALRDRGQDTQAPRGEQTEAPRMNAEGPRRGTT